MWETIASFFDKFKNYFSKEEPRGLSDIPPHIKQQIVENLDLVSRTKLRQTCSAFEDAVNHARLHIANLRFEFGANKIEITIDNLKIVFVYVSDTVTAITHNGRYHLFEDEDHDVVTCADETLTNILKNKMITVDTLDIVEHKSEVFRNKNEWRLDSRSKKQCIQDVIHHLNTTEYEDIPQLKVSHLNYETLEKFEDLLYILHSLDEKSIVSVKMRGTREPMSADDDDELQQIFELDQWENLEKIDILQPCAACNLMEMAHANWVDLNAISFPSLEEFEELLENLLENETLNQMRVKCPETTESLDNYHDVKGHLVKIGHPHVWDATWHHVNHPKGSGNRLAVRVARRRIWFRGPCYNKEDWEEGDGDQADGQIVDKVEVEDATKDDGW